MNRVLVTSCVVLIVANLAWGAPVGLQFLSAQHHVWGAAGTDSTQPGQFPGGVYDSYDVAASHSVFGSAAGIEVFSPGYSYPVDASSRAGSFQVEAHGVRWTGIGYAESVYTFQPEEGTLSLTLDAAGYASATTAFDVLSKLTLEDLTTATIMEDFSWPGGDLDWMDHGSFAWQETYSVDPGHTYGLRLYTCASGGDWMSDTYMKVGLNDVVPAPGAVLLGVLGTGLVGWLRRRRAL